MPISMELKGTLLICFAVLLSNPWTFLIFFRLALVTGGEIVSTFDNPESVKLGTCDLIEQIMIGEDILLRFSGVALGEACSIGKQP